MADLHGFDANQVKPTTDFVPLPAGKYLAVIVESEFKPTKSGNGSYLELTFEVIDGEHKGRKLWARLNLDNPNPTAVEIARAELSAICHCNTEERTHVICSHATDCSHSCSFPNTGT